MRAASSAAQRASAASLSSEEYEMKTSWAIGRFKLNADWNPLRASRPRQERRSLFRTSRGKTVERQAVESLDVVGGLVVDNPRRSEEHTSELQSQSNLVCRLLLEKQTEMSKWLV